MQSVLSDRLNDFLKGFKELRLRRKRSAALFDDFKQAAASLRSSLVQTSIINEENYIIT
jgi:ABC-type siderophore export system fused ATPase/permease subunit